MRSDKIYNLLFSIDRGYIPHFKTALNSLLKNNEEKSFRLFLMSSDLTESDFSDIEFSDESDISIYAKSAVAYFAKSGIINGVGENKFSPRSDATRAEAAKMIYECIKKYS